MIGMNRDHALIEMMRCRSGDYQSAGVLNPELPGAEMIRQESATPSHQLVWRHRLGENVRERPLHASENQNHTSSLLGLQAKPTDVCWMHGDEWKNSYLFRMTKRKRKSSEPSYHLIDLM